MVSSLDFKLSYKEYKINKLNKQTEDCVRCFKKEHSMLLAKFTSRDSRSDTNAFLDTSPHKIIDSFFSINNHSGER